ncbi:MAG: hypothetical protein LQ338_000530 [Usnochroma carphineum]|nr:MAG: hypothetical protein LQ338_000530 [Usnochroma carphineum]
MRLFYRNGPAPQNRQQAIRGYEYLSVEDRTVWETRAVADRARFEQEKRDYNNTIDLEEEINSDNEAMDDFECGNGVQGKRLATLKRRCEQQWARYRRDHPKFNQSYKAPEQAVGPGYLKRFMELPVEIRNQIYAYTLPSYRDGRALRQWQLTYEIDDIDDDDQLRFTDLQPLDTRILAVSREVYAGALDMLYSTNCFTVDIAMASALPLFIQDATGLSPPRPTSRIRRWHIRLTSADVRQLNITWPQLFAVRNVMKQCVHLDEVRFTWLSGPHLHYSGKVCRWIRKYDGMLKLFEDVRGVGNVVFTDTFSEAEPCLASEKVRKAVKASMESPRP